MKFLSITPSLVTNMGGNLPLMTAITNSLMGSRYIAISKSPLPLPLPRPWGSLLSLLASICMSFSVGY